MDVSKYLDPIVLAVITGLIGFVVKFVFNYVHALSVNKKFLSLKAVAETAVKTAEQLYADPKTGEQKYTLAAKYVAAFAKKNFKLDLSEDEIKLFIESAVNTLVSDVKAEAPKAEQK